MSASHTQLLPLDQGVFKHLWVCGGRGGMAWFAGGVQREGFSGQTNLLIAFTSLLHIAGNTALTAERSQWRAEATTTKGKGSFITERGPETQVGRKKGRGSAQRQNLGEKLLISWQAPPKHLFPYLSGRTQWSQTSSLQHTCQ